jgi:hypothetical protein
MAHMKRFFFLILCLFLFIAGKGPTDNGEWIDMKVFMNPGVDYRSAPFYALNDLLDTTELIRQIHGFKTGGFGGSFLHSRGGLLTEYMGHDWWEAMDAAVKTSKQIGLKAWFYDEDKWPSGFAGGKIPLMNEEFHARCLSRIDKNERIKENVQVLLEDNQFKYFVHKASMGNSWFNGTAYVDLLNQEMVKAFIDSAYAPYLNRFKDEIGKTVPGIFTDEPQVSPRVSGGREGSVSYSPILLKRFKEMHGYDLLPHIPSLFDTIGNFKKLRYDYYQTLSCCFEESFTQQIGEYCGAEHAIFTGHLNGEETFRSAMINSGNSMVNYRHMQMPGIDQLGLHYLPLNAARSVSSVANQYGILRRMSESYGISGQNMNFEDRKWLLDWLTLNGINFIVPHLSLYSMKGERKRDYPPNFSPAQPYWEYNKLFEDYSARMCYVNTIGTYATDLLLIHPLESEYLGIKDNDCYQKYDQCLNLLQRHHRNYDLGDEQIMAEIANVDNKQLTIGKMKYKMVVLPNMLVIRRSTLNLLKQFSSAGGAILVYGKVPEYVDGEQSPQAIDSLRRMCQLVDETNFPRALDLLLPCDFKLGGTDNELVWTHYRRVENGGILQLSNTSRLKEVDCTLTFSSAVNNLALWNPENGHSMKIVPERDGRIRLHFAATTSWIVTFGNASKEADLTYAYQIPVSRKEVTKIAGSWQGHRLDPNTLTLDFASYSTDSGKTYSKPEPVIGIHQRFTNNKYSGPLILKFDAEVINVPAKCSLVVEQPQLYKIFINGNKINFDGAEFYRDHAFRLQDISGTLKVGHNQILLSMDYMAPQRSSLDAMKRYGTEIESIYLVGDFAVAATPSENPLKESQKYRDHLLVSRPVYSMSRFAITKEDSSFDNDLVLKGYPFYAGSFSLKNTFHLQKVSKKDKYFISFPSFEAIVLKVRINGKEFLPLVYSPWEIDISEAISAGDNTIEITLINSLRNLLGPHHHVAGELNEVGPASFTGNPEWPNSAGENNWYELRLSGNATIWRDDYCLIPFGLLKPPVISVSN